MAEQIVSFVIDKLIQLLITTEANLSSNARTEVGFIKDELESIRSFLKEADAKAAAADGETGNDGVKTWVNQVREATFYIEDVIDEYLLHIIQHHQHHGFIRFFHKIIRSVKKKRSQDGIVLKVDCIKKLVREIKDRSERYGFKSIDQRGQSSGEETLPWNDPRVASLFIEEAEIVGIESARDELTRLLVEGAPRREVISTVGMGGLGKTTLAKKVYDQKKVVAHFDCYAWITVSQSYRVEDLLRTVIKKFYSSRKERFPEEIDTMDEESLISTSREYLQQKRYVVVFDDVWKVDFWGAIEHALPDNNGGRIIITTRIQDVANFCKRSCFVHVHHLQHLPQDKAWELFCRKVFQFELEGKCPEELEELSLSIVERCEGLPLAIVSIGGLLSTKAKVVSEWQTLYNSLSSELESNPYLTSLTRILSLSYHHLPYYLKLCVLYFGIFPEDYSKELGKLRQLRKLSLTNLKSEDGRAVCASIEKMNHLESLLLTAINEDEVLDLESISTPPQFIRSLGLIGRLEQLPGWISNLQHLVRLVIFWSRLGDSPLKALQNLPNLLELVLEINAYDGVQLHFEEGGFQKLRELRLREIMGLNSLIIDDGVMPLLQEFHIRPSPQLKEVPSGIHHLRNLTYLYFYDMPKEFARQMDPKNGKHYWIVEHIQNVLFRYKDGPRWGVYETHALRDSNFSLWSNA
ncbi:disease resistance protein RPM1-like [Pyrus communis]|uniref:disease resistance protein RPM1-like n=1 Tax=Pyrus communis TaxID=23211 RepID=UPI0035C15CBE